MGCAGVQSTRLPAPTVQYTGTGYWTDWVSLSPQAFAVLQYFVETVGRGLAQDKATQNMATMGQSGQQIRSVSLNGGRITELTRGTGYAAFANFREVFKLP